MRDREIQCLHYVCEGKCNLGKDSNFWGYCQTCPFYKKKPGGKPARTDNRRQKAERIARKEKWDY